MSKFDLTSANFMQAENALIGRVPDENEVNITVLPRKTASGSDKLRVSIRTDVIENWQIDKLTAAIVKAGKQERLYFKPSKTGYKAVKMHHGKCKNANRLYFTMRISGNLKDYFKYEGRHRFLEYDEENNAFYVEL